MNFLPGKIMIGAAGFQGGSGASGPQMSFFDDKTVVGSATLSVAGLGINIGDLLIWVDRARDSGGTAPTLVIPSGFTLIGTTIFEAGSSTRVAFAYKIATSGDTGGTLTGMDAFREQKCLQVWRPDSEINSVTAFSFSSSMDNSNQSSKTATASSGTPPLIVCGSGGAFSADVTFSLSVTANVETEAFNGTNGSQVLHSKVYNSGPTENVSTSMGDEGAHNNEAVWYLEIT